MEPLALQLQRPRRVQPGNHGMAADITSSSERTLLHYDLAGHLGMDGAEVVVRARFAEGVSKFLMGIQDLRLETLVSTDHSVWDLVLIDPAYRCSDWNCDRWRRKSEAINPDLDLYCGWFGCDGEHFWHPRHRDQGKHQRRHT